MTRRVYRRDWVIGSLHLIWRSRLDTTQWGVECWSTPWSTRTLDLLLGTRMLTAKWGDL